ncbi:thioesterase II family protein [Tenacibaculum sp. C7A-26P2]|uniref:thioesterase II family protein n=1 Tax=Tenacibaculum sp. C7A-26P2 TaxID=3447504 RepID=UPI003F855567
MMKIIALPFAGGNKYSFKKLEKFLPNSVAWITLELPGRGGRFDQPILEDINLMVSDLFEQIKLYVSEDEYMIYGHSMGTVLGYELTKLLVKLKYKLPQCLFFTGRGAPGVHEMDRRSILPKNKFWVRVKNMGGLPKEILEHEELLELFYPILKADFKALENYQFIPMHTPLPMPIFINIGADEVGDTIDKISMEAIEAWKKETLFPQKTEFIPGDHFFILTYPEHVVTKIVNAFHTAVKINEQLKKRIY